MNKIHMAGDISSFNDVIQHPEIHNFVKISMKWATPLTSFFVSLELLDEEHVEKLSTE